MRKPLQLKLRQYAVHMIDLNSYVDEISGSKASEKMVRWNGMKFCLTVSQINVSGKRMFRGFILNLLIKKSVYMFKRIYILEYIYEGVVELYYLKTY